MTLPRKSPARFDVAAAVRQANVPTLLLFLVQATGDRRWLDEPYRPLRTEGLGVNDTGGLPPAIQAEIRRAAAAALERWLDDGHLAIPEPTAEMVTEMLSASLGEDVPAAYGPLLRWEWGRFSRDKLVPDASGRPPAGFRVLVVGAGMSGLVAAAYLAEAGIDFMLVEKNPEPGGTWWQNRYPGAGVDTPSHLYSFSFARHDWGYHFELQPEIQRYMGEVAARLGIAAVTRFETEVVSSRWDDAAARWVVDLRCADGALETVKVDAVISAVGVLNRPMVPNIDGLDQFSGEVVHTAAWPDGLTLAGRKVGLVGTGASAMQVGPAIADSVEQLVVFQRSPQWVAPFELFREPLSDGTRQLLERVPPYHGWYWLRLFWQFGDRVLTALRVDPAWDRPDRAVNARNDGHRQHFTDYIRSKLADRTDLVSLVVPDYPPFGKRILLDNGWYDMLAKPNVVLVPAAVDRVTASEVMAGGRSFEVDTLIMATGFEASRFVASMDVVGREGCKLAEVWSGDDGRALHGISVPGFPNFFMLGGPNTFPGSGSFMYVIEVQMQHIRRLLSKMFDAGIAAIEPKPTEFERFNDAVDAAHQGLVWTHPGMRTYYRNERGRVVFLSPFTNLEIWERSLSPDLSMYDCRPRV